MYQMGMLKIQYQSNIGINMICMPCDESHIQVHVVRFEIIISSHHRPIIWAFTNTYHIQHRLLIIPHPHP